MTGGSIDTSEVQGLAARLAAVPKELHRQVRKPLRQAGQAMLAEAKANSSWSSRIPSSMTLRVTLAGRRPGVSIRAALKDAPHARVYEGILGDSFRHPLFGDYDFWYPQQARSYLLPAVDESAQRIVDEIARVLDDVHAQAGLT